jgi:hypothetical protein
MFLRFERQRCRLCVALVVNRRVGGKVRQKRLGYLGSVTCSDGPISARERIRFWAAINQKFLAIRAGRPEGISIADEERILAAIDSRIPRPREARQNRQSVERNGESAVPKTKRRSRAREAAFASSTIRGAERQHQATSRPQQT